MKTVFVNFGYLLTYFEECQLFIYIFRANVSCLFTFSATCLHCQRFVYIFNQVYIIVSAVCLHCQLSVYIFNCLFTLSAVCLHWSSSFSCLFIMQILNFRTKYIFWSQCDSHQGCSSSQSSLLPSKAMIGHKGHTKAKHALLHSHSKRVNRTESRNASKRTQNQKCPSASLGLDRIESFPAKFPAL